ncbi:hypothetical protein CLV63_113160 [Murinocardiopsis flavida]|uniref:Uncharacterized protein n=1 Tax=Murinocardiopsis flavida TaxID=645275 RepID=A0A2P8DFN1_9ACTN|nr:hypothetical protein CLV63_113160 [Murinocardiopsis flavida]
MSQGESPQRGRPGARVRGEAVRGRGCPKARVRGEGVRDPRGQEPGCRGACAAATADTHPALWPPGSAPHGTHRNHAQAPSPRRHRSTAAARSVRGGAWRRTPGLLRPSRAPAARQSRSGAVGACAGFPAALPTSAGGTDALGTYPRYEAEVTTHPLRSGHRAANNPRACWVNGIGAARSRPRRPSCRISARRGRSRRQIHRRNHRSRRRNHRRNHRNPHRNHRRNHRNPRPNRRRPSGIRRGVRAFG